MGTRADFYVGRGTSAEWLGSIAWDVYPDGLPKALRTASTEQDFRQQVATLLAESEDGTLPEQGWPWPWDDSTTTDYAYAFDAGTVWASSFGYAWFPAAGPEPEDEKRLAKACDFPDMRARKRPTLGPRSGVLVVSLK